MSLFGPFSTAREGVAHAMKELAYGVGYPEVLDRSAGEVCFARFRLGVWACHLDRLQTRAAPSDPDALGVHAAAREAAPRLAKGP